MKELKGNLFEIDADAICITTNGFVKSNGECVMGKGCAKQAATLIKELPLILGKSIKANGNIVQAIWEQNNTVLLAYPVKPISDTFNGHNTVEHMKAKFKYGDTVPGWACKASITIIEQSAYQLLDITNEMGWSKVLIPRPGCGAGELNWQDIKPLLESILDDRFISVTF